MPERCETCEHRTMQDRREDYGDVCMPACKRLGVWLDFYEDGDAPCE